MPDFAEEELLALLTGASTECNGVSEEEFDEVFTSLKKLFASKSCWEKLCDVDYITALSYKIYFEFGAKCAGVELDLPECVFDKVIELLVIFATEPAPASPTDEELFYLVSTYLVTPAIDQCGATEVDADESTSDILAILQSLSSPTCASDTPQMRTSFLTTAAETNIDAGGYETTSNANIAGGSGSYAASSTGAFVVSAIGCVIAIAGLVAGFYHIKNKRQERMPLEAINEMEYL